MPALLLNCKHQFQYCNKILHLKFYCSPLTSFLPLSPTYYIIPVSSPAWHCSDIKTWNFPTFHFSFFPSLSEPLAVTCAIEQLSQSNKGLHTIPKQPEQVKTSMPNTTASHTHTQTPSRAQPCFYTVHWLKTQIFLSVRALSASMKTSLFHDFSCQGSVVLLSI